jgi:FkbM family methyltransferase
MGLFRLFRFIFRPGINRFLGRLLRPFGRFIPARYQFPVLGFFKIRVNGNASFYMEGHLTSYITKVCFWHGIKGFEYDSARIYCDLVKNMQLFLDIGANIGYYSLLAASISKKLNVIAFEPFHDAYAVLKSNIAYNGFKNIKAEETALSDKKGDATLYYTINKDFPDYKYQLGGRNSLIKYDNNLTGKIVVPTTTLDDYAIRNGIDEADLIKLDTEATEYFILKGAEKLIKKCRPLIQCEVLTGSNEVKLEEFLLLLGYGFYQVNADGLHLKSSLKDSLKHKNDYFFIPGGKEHLITPFLVS